MFDIVESNPCFVLIDKYPDVDFHREGAAQGLMDVLRHALGVDRLYAVHRLDKMTSGLLLFARTPVVAATLAEQFRQRKVEKYYLALTDKAPGKKQGLVIGDMARSRRSAWKLLTSRDNPAITQCFSVSMGPGLRLFLLRPRTGRTHQLRVAMKSLGAPIVGDPIYHPANLDRPADDRGYLHAYALRFELDGQQYTFCRPPLRGRLFASAGFELALAQYRQPWALEWPRPPSARNNIGIGEQD